MKIKYFLLLLILCCFACKNNKNEKFVSQEQKFDKNKWAVKNEEEYPYRDQMLKDFMDHYKVNGLKKEEILKLLGEPTYTNNGYLYYRISRQFLAILPIPFHTKTLVIKLTADSTVEWRKIHQ